jgi:SAM-dependent methyltransferase
MDPYLRANRAHWDELVPHHERSRFYDLDAFRAGRCTLDGIDVREIGEVRGRSLLHLQCHFGLDTLSWARRGARVTGADFAPAAVELATRLAAELQLDARFICANLYDLPECLEGEFDVVYTGGGALCWLPDLEGWARVAAHFVRPGGFLYLREIHPLSLVFDDGREDGEMVARYPYFPGPKPLRFEGDGSYAAEAKLRNRVTYEWPYPLGTVVTSLIRAGLRIQFLHEHQVQCYRQFPWMTQGEDGCWRLPGGPSLPLSFSLKASKER